MDRSSALSKCITKFFVSHIIFMGVFWLSFRDPQCQGFGLTQVDFCICGLYLHRTDKSGVCNADMFSPGLCFSGYHLQEHSTLDSSWQYAEAILSLWEMEKAWKQPCSQIFHQWVPRLLSGTFSNWRRSRNLWEPGLSEPLLWHPIGPEERIWKPMKWVVSDTQ